MDFRVAAVLPASGVGERVGSCTPKQFCKLLHKPLITYTIDAFEKVRWIDPVVVVVSPDRVDFTRQLLKEHGGLGPHRRRTLIAVGGSSRHRSIHNGIKFLTAQCGAAVDVVVIHDAVRPFVDEETLREVATAAHEHGAAGMIRPLVSTVIGTDLDGFLESSLERIKYRASEMPQAFQLPLIRAAYGKCTDYDLDYGTECLHLAQKYMRCPVRLIDGPDNLWKVTHKKDLYAAEGVVKEQASKEVIVMGVCAESLRRSLAESFSQFGAQVKFHADIPEQFVSRHHGNVILIFNAPLDFVVMETRIKDLCAQTQQSPSADRISRLTPRFDDAGDLSTSDPSGARQEIHGQELPTTETESGATADPSGDHSNSHVSPSGEEQSDATRTGPPPGGAVVAVVEVSDPTETERLRAFIQDASRGLRTRGVCVSAIVNQNVWSDAWCDLAASLVFHRNLLLSGQTLHAF